jgi:LysM repeat protein
MIRKIALLLTLTAGSISGFAQKSYDQQVSDYIEKYKAVAVEEQRRSGVPASITLAQGILETSAGQSELCNNASNHFGIKCKNTWTGDTYTYTDDAKDECFRKYESARVSYADHSDFLKTNKRYSNLFMLSPTDYAAWAYGLKRCGYATNPQYAQKLIKFIEDYNLQTYTYAALDINNSDEILYASAAGGNGAKAARRTNVSTVVPGENIPVADANYVAAKTTKEADYNAEDEIYVEKAAPQQEDRNNTSGVTQYYATTTKNGLKGFYAKKGDMLLEYAIKNKIRYAKILEFNDLPDAPLEADMFIYLSHKPKTGKIYTHTVESGETLLQISQMEGIQLADLMTLNHLQNGQQPIPGSVLNLQTVSDKVPDVYVSNAPATSAATSTSPKVTRSSNDAAFVPAGKKENTPPPAANDDATEVAPAPAVSYQKAKAEPAVNIANEPAVEDEVATTIPAKKQIQNTTSQNEKKMSALDKLKAHMDQVVYNEKGFEPKSTGTYDATKRKPVVDEEDAPEEVVAKVPAKKVAAKSTEKPEQKVTPKAAKGKEKTHTVKKGETLYSIAEKYDLTVKELQKLNKTSSKTIQVGDKLKVK